MSDSALPQDTDHEGAARLQLISEHLGKAVRNGLRDGITPDPQNPEWLRQALADCPISPDELEKFLDLMDFQAKVAPAMFRVTQQLLRTAPPGGGMPKLEGAALRKALEDDGALTAEQIERVVSDLSGPFNPGG